jgi:hypothetical protein
MANKTFEFRNVQYNSPTNDGPNKKYIFLDDDDIIRWGSLLNIRRAFNGSERELKNEDLIRQALEYANIEINIWLTNNCISESRVSDLDIKLNYIAELYALSYLEIFADSLSTTEKSRDLKYKARADNELAELLNYYVFGSDACNRANKYITQCIIPVDSMSCCGTDYQRYGKGDCCGNGCIDDRSW